MVYDIYILYLRIHLDFFKWDGKVTQSQCIASCVLNIQQSLPKQENTDIIIFFSFSVIISFAEKTTLSVNTTETKIEKYDRIACFWQCIPKSLAFVMWSVVIDFSTRVSFLKKNTIKKTVTNSLLLTYYKKIGRLILIRKIDLRMGNKPWIFD